MADLFKVEAEVESSHIISVAAATTEDDDEAVSSLKWQKGLAPDDDSGSSPSSLHMYEDPTDDLADTAALPLVLPLLATARNQFFWICKFTKML